MFELLPLAETAQLPIQDVPAESLPRPDSLDGEIKWLTVGTVAYGLGRRYIMAKFPTKSVGNVTRVERPEIPQAWYAAAAVLLTVGVYGVTGSVWSTALFVGAVCLLVGSVSLWALRRSPTTDDVERLANDPVD